MDFIPFDDFTPIQQQILAIKLENTRLTWPEWRAKIKSECNIKMQPVSLVRFVKKSALGLPWVPNGEGGRHPFLSPTDMQELKNSALERCRNGTNYLELSEFLELALEIKTARLLSAAKFLRTINCPKIASLLSAEEELEPSRVWINTTAEQLGFTLETPQDIEANRLDASSKSLIKRFYQIHKQLVESCPRALIFGADETMLKSVMRTKVLTHSGSDKILREESDIPHITSMCCHSVTGERVPPFIILPNSLMNLPLELQEYVSADKAWFASSKSGWMNKDLFLIWSIHFINWMSIYRRRLPASVRHAKSLLILDGHGSRECPLALEMLRRNDINVLVLPAHTTHITQMFDVGIASSLKSHFAKNMRKLLNEEVVRKSQISKLRACAVKAFITAWETSCTVMTCEKAAAKTGWFPFDEDAASLSRYAQERTAEEDAEYMNKRSSRARLDINGRVINTSDFINEIREKTRNHPHLSHLAAFPNETVPWGAVCSFYCKKKLNNNSYFLSKIPPFVSDRNVMVCFD